MKKTLIAVAALTAVSAFAQSSVTLSGIIKGGVAHTKYSNGPVGSVNGNGLSVADGSSRFIIGGTEDLGGGLKAVFQIDTRFRMDDNGGAVTSSPLANGNTFVGLSGGLGVIQLGKMDTHYCLGQDSHGSRATAHQANSCALIGYVGVNGNSSIANASRATNTIRYTTPTFSGFKGELNYSTAFNGPEGAVGEAGKGKAVSAKLLYGNGPLKAGFSIWDAKSESRLAGAARSDQKAYTLFGDYNFGVATVGLTYDQSEINGGLVGAADAKTKRNVWSIPVTVPLGAGTFLFTYTKAGNGERNGVDVANSSAALWSLGYDYSLSKRTKVGVSYARLNNKANAGYALYGQSSANGTPNNAVGQDASQLYVGLRHAF
jgi:predicted porin